MKKFFVGTAFLLCFFAASCSAHGERPFSDLSAEDISSFTISCMPPGKTVETSDEEYIKELSDILNNVVVYEEDSKEYAGQSVDFTIEKTDGTQLRVNSYSPQIIIDGVKYRAKLDSCDELSEFGNDLSEELPSINKSFEDIKALLSSYPSNYDSVLQSNCYVISNGEAVSNQNLFDEFADNVDSGLADDIIIAVFTAEGDPIYSYVYFDGTIFTCTVDTSRDRYSDRDNEYEQYEYKYMLTSKSDTASYTFLSDDPSAVFVTDEADPGYSDENFLLFSLNIDASGQAEE